jgi:hypothetical protein
MTTDYEVVTYEDDSQSQELRCFQLIKGDDSEPIVNRRVLIVQLAMVNTVVGRVHKRERRAQNRAYHAH